MGHTQEDQIPYLEYVVFSVGSGRRSFMCIFVETSCPHNKEQDKCYYHVFVISMVALITAAHNGHIYCSVWITDALHGFFVSS